MRLPDLAPPDRILVPKSWTQEWFLGWYRDVFMRLAKPAARDLRDRPTLHDFGVRTAEEAGWSRDFTAEMQAAFDWVSSQPGNLGGTLFAHSGHYRAEKRLLARSRLHIQGDLRDDGTIFNCYGTDDNEALLIDGANGSGGWLFNFSISKVRLELNAFQGGNPELVKIRQAYSCIFDQFTLGSVTEDYTPLTIGYINDVSFRNLIVGGVYGSPKFDNSVVVDSTPGHIWKLRFYEPDVEIGKVGFRFQGSNALIAEICSMYTEQLDTAVYWDASGAESALSITDGLIVGNTTGNIGVDIRRSNCSVVNLKMMNAGSIGVDIDNATSWDNCHVIGGHFNVTTPVRDTYNRLTTNSFA